MCNTNVETFRISTVNCNGEITAYSESQYNDQSMTVNEVKFVVDSQGWIGYAGTHVPMFVHKLGLIKSRQT